MSSIRTIVKSSTSCLACFAEFVPRRSEKYCSHACYAGRHGVVKRQCESCGDEFEVPYRFRGKKTCSRACFTALASKNMSAPRKDVSCLACGKKTPVAENDGRQYCSYDCFLSTRKSRQPDVELTCENCKCHFFVPFSQAEIRRFCGKSCANSGEFNGMYGKPGTMTGRAPWTQGLTKETDERIKRSAEKRSEIIAQKIVNGEWMHSTGFKGEHYDGKKSTRGVTYLRSSYESKYARMLDEDVEVVEWTHEPFRIPYMFEGYAKNYIPDFLVKYENGTDQLVEVKPKILSESPVNLAKSLAAKKWCEANDAKYVVVCEADLEETFHS